MFKVHIYKGERGDKIEYSSLAKTFGPLASRTPSWETEYSSPISRVQLTLLGDLPRELEPLRAPREKKVIYSMLWESYISSLGLQRITPRK